MKALMVVTDGFEEIEAIGTLALLRRAKIDVTFASLYGDKATGRYGVTSSHMVPLKTLDPLSFDCLIIPGGPEYNGGMVPIPFYKGLHIFFPPGVKV